MTPVLSIEFINSKKYFTQKELKYLTDLSHLKIRRLLALLPRSKRHFLKLFPRAEVVFVNRSYIKMLNKRYYKTAKVTDILTFPLLESEILGTLFIAPIYAREKFARFLSSGFNGGFHAFIVYLIIHGILHILFGGHRQFEELEDKLWQNE